MMKKDKNNQNINSIPKYLWGNYFKKPIKWLAHLINDYGNSSYDGLGLAAPSITSALSKFNKNYNLNLNKKWPTNNLVAAAASLFSPVLGAEAVVPDIVFDVAASIDEPSTSNTIHTIADFPETVAKFTPSKIDDYVAKGVLTLGNIDDAVSTSGRNMFSNFDKKSGKINNTTDKTSVRESTNIRYRKNGGFIRKMLTAAGGPIELYNTLWVDNWKNRLTSPIVVAKQLEELTSKIPIKYLGGSKDNARKEFWKQEPVLQHAVDSVAGLYGINPESLKYRLDKEGFTDRLIKRVNTSVKQGTQRVHGRGYKLLNDPNLGLAGTQIGLDDARTYIDSGKVKLINENWYEQGPFKNEKGRMTYPVNPVTLNDGIGIVAAHLKYFRDKALLDFPNASEYDLDRYANAYYNRGALGGKKWVLAGAKGYNYRKKGGMLEFLKNGSGIHIKEKNKGKFTSYCGGKVTDECILKGKNSSNPAIRKRATFAANARKWKHKEGGIIKAEDGTKFNWQSALTNMGTNLFSSYLQSRIQNNKINSEAEAAKAENEVDLNQYFWDIYLQELAKALLEEELKNKAINAMNDTVINSSPLVTLKKAYDRASQNYGALKANLDARNKAIDAQAEAAKSSVITDAVSGVIQNGLGMLKDYYGSKNNNTSTSSSTGNSNSYFDNYVNTKYKKFGTFNPDGSMNMLGGTFTIKDGYKPNQPQLFNYQPLKLNV